MPVDIAMITHVLAILAAYRDEMPEDVLAAEVEARVRRPLTTAAVREALRQCQDRNWVETKEDYFGRDVWKITAAGLEKHRTP